MKGEGVRKDRSRKRGGSHSGVSQSDAAACLDLHMDCTKERQNCLPSMPLPYCQGGSPISTVCWAFRMAGFYLGTNIFISAEWTNSDFLRLHNQLLLTVIRVKYVQWRKTAVNEDIASLVSILPKYPHLTAWSIYLKMSLKGFGTWTERLERIVSPAVVLCYAGHLNWPTILDPTESSEYFIINKQTKKKQTNKKS